MKRLAAGAIGDTALESTWHGKQVEEPGTLLPIGFPSKTALEAVGYIAVEDVHGADARELSRNVALNARQATSVITAAAALI